VFSKCQHFAQREFFVVVFPEQRQWQRKRQQQQKPNVATSIILHLHATDSSNNTVGTAKVRHKLAVGFVLSLNIALASPVPLAPF